MTHDFNWQETYMIDEVPHNDVWDNFATKQKIAPARHPSLFLEENSNDIPTSIQSTRTAHKK